MSPWWGACRSNPFLPGTRLQCIRKGWSGGRPGTQSGNQPWVVPCWSDCVSSNFSAALVHSQTGDDWGIDFTTSLGLVCHPCKVPVAVGGSRQPTTLGRWLYKIGMSLCHLSPLSVHYHWYAWSFLGSGNWFVIRKRKGSPFCLFFLHLGDSDHSHLKNSVAKMIFINMLCIIYLLTFTKN
jgi:hypothetical protein